MTRAILLAAVALSGCAQYATPQAAREAGDAAGIAFTSQSVALPDETAAFPADAAIVTAHCIACHSPELILTQPKLKPETWQAEIAKMRTAYKAAIPEADDARLVAALVALQGRPPQK